MKPQYNVIVVAWDGHVDDVQLFLTDIAAEAKFDALTDNKYKGDPQGYDSFWNDPKKNQHLDIYWYTPTPEEERTTS